jgi:hypothetical protein
MVEILDVLQVGTTWWSLDTHWKKDIWGLIAIQGTISMI